MKKTTFILVMTFCFVSCSKNQSDKVFAPHKDIKEAAIAYFELKVKESCRYNGFYDRYILCEKKDDVFRTFNVSEVVQLSRTDSYVVFYSYSSGSDVVRGCSYFIKKDGVFLLTHEYGTLSKQSPDKGVVASKINNWRKGNENIKWHSETSYELDESN